MVYVPVGSPVAVEFKVTVAALLLHTGVVTEILLRLKAGFTTTLAVLFALIALLQVAPAILVTTMLEVPAAAKAIVENEPVPADETVMVAVLPVAAFTPVMS